MGCYSQDNPADPGRCDPPCKASETCWEGTCRPDDGGTPDAGADTLVDTDGDTWDQGADADGDASADASTAGPAIVYKTCTANGATQTNSTSMGTISCADGDFSVDLTANGTDKYLFILNVPESWAECKLGDYYAHVDAYFQLNDGSDILTASGYAASHGQRMPMTLIGAKVLSAGQHTIDVRWAKSTNCPTGVVKHGNSASSLIVVRADPQDLQATYGPTSAKSLAASQDWIDMPIPSFTVPSPGGDYLLVLTTPPTHGAKNASVQYRIRRVHNGTDTAIGEAHALHTASAASGTFPVTIVEATNLQAGDVIRAQWKNYSTSAVQMVPVGGAVNVGWLVGLRTPKGIQSVKRSTYAVVGTDSKVPKDIDNLPLLKVSSKGGNHLIAFTSNQSRTCAYAPYYAAAFGVEVDGAAQVNGYFSAHGNSNLQACQSIPVTLFTVKDLAAGSHNIRAKYWTSQSPHDNGKVYTMMAKLMALTR